MMVEKYLSIKTVGHDYVKAWKNKDKKEGSNEPDFKGDGVAVWVFTYEEKKKQEAESHNTSHPPKMQVEEEVL